MSVHGLLRNTAILAAALLCDSNALMAQDSATADTFSLKCGELSLDLRSNGSVCANVQISDGTISISAAEGTADETSFQNSEWQFTSNVRIAFQTTVILADHAIFNFSNNELIFGELTGTPVELQDFVPEQNADVRGTAESVSYDNRDGTARMQGEATLALGENEYFGCDLVYNLNEKTINSGSADCGVTVRIRAADETEAQPNETSQRP